MNEHGYWTPGSPETGLSKLFPNFETRADYEETACSVRIVADTADPARVQGITWIDAKQASLDLKYCVKVSCPSPVAWDALPSVVLYSSHASRNQYWRANYYVDILAEGTATGPGGYCSATGGLTDNFQG